VSSPSAAVVVRPAAPGDVTTIYGFIRELAEYERAPDAVTGTPEMLHQALFGPRPSAESLLAVDENGKSLGFALFYATFSTWECRPGIWLEDLFVPARLRRGGVGGALLSELAAIAVKRGCARLEWTALDWNAPAIAFYAGQAMGRPFLKSLGAETRVERERRSVPVERGPFKPRAPALHSERRERPEQLAADTAAAPSLRHEQVLQPDPGPALPRGERPVKECEPHRLTARIDREQGFGAPTRSEQRLAEHVGGAGDRVRGTLVGRELADEAVHRRHILRLRGPDRHCAHAPVGGVISRLRILPVGPLGSSSMIHTDRGYL
jgi:GNAT superfamily N-acetyltransferase